MTFRRLLAVLLPLLPLLAGLTACETSPATGKQIFTAGMSPQQEIQLGREQHPKIVEEFGGAYDDPDLGRYVSSIGNLLASTSELPNLQFTFTVLDSPIVNAFALPGGYVYVTRGLLALADNEAELAGVLAHEIGHVTARHAASRYGRTVAASLATAGLGLLFGQGAASDLAGGVAAIAVQSYSREQEFESDFLGVRYLSRAGYDPKAMSSFLETLLAHSRLEAELSGQPGQADSFSLLQTHPRTADRVERAIREAGVKSVADPLVARDIYLGKIEGLLYGDDPRNGYVRGSSFLHPELRFAFEAPEDFRLVNSRDSVTALGPGGAAILFDRAGEPFAGAMSDYLVKVWGEGVELSNVEAITVNGLPAATAETRGQTQGGVRDLRLVAVRYDRNAIYRFIFLTPPNLTQRLAPDLRRTTYSFRRLSRGEAARLKPLRVGLYDVRPGDTPSSIARRMPFDDYRLERFLVLNGLDKGSTLRAGEEVKVITE